MLSAKRIERQDLLPFGIVGAVLLSLYSVGAAVYVPHLFNTYATRYGVIGAVFAIISALFCVMVVVVGSAAAGREVRDELDRIRRGERPAEDEVRRQWDQVIAEARSRWDTLRAQIQERRRPAPRRLSQPDGAGAGWPRAAAAARGPAARWRCARPRRSAGRRASARPCRTEQPAPIVTTSTTSGLRLSVAPITNGWIICWSMPFASRATTAMISASDVLPVLERDQHREAAGDPRADEGHVGPHERDDRDRPRERHTENQRRAPDQDGVERGDDRHGEEVAAQRLGDVGRDDVGRSVRARPGAG